jgi:hypothetical protein
MGRIKILLFFLLFLLGLLFPLSSNAQECSSTNPCEVPETDPQGCIGGSASCDNGVCNVTWECNNNSACWSDWSPSPCTSGEYQTRECYSVYQIQNCGGGGGGGGAYQYPTCEGSQVLKCGNDPVLYLSGGGGETNDANLASCSYKIGCGDSYFPSAFTETGCDGKETKGQCQTNCDCCNAGENYVKSTVTGSNYTREVSCHSSITSLYCNDWDDTFVSRSYGTGAGNCYCICENEDGCGANCTRGGNWVKNDIITCTSKTTTWSCVPTCTATSPSTPTLISPSNGSTISSTSVTLAWSNTGQTWGTACGSQNNQFRVYIGTSPSSLGLLGTVGSGTAGRLPESST